MASDTSKAPTSKTATLRETAKAGMPFQMVVPERYSLKELRDYVREETGLAMHVKARIGPTRLSPGGELTCDFTAIDDPHLILKLEVELPPRDHSMYVGYFKEEEKKQV
ncbi:MAG: hypothetical protein KBE09_05600 [Candidatus Pacebacteria bacterium]|nr:hypothetical protein [Candidatus Paceibacterota bacterium]